MKKRKIKKKATVVIVGGGPIGLAHAWGIKKLNPNIHVVLLEKYEVYQRSHTLIMQPKALEALMIATDSLEDPLLSGLLMRLKNDPHIRTNELESLFKKLTIQNGVEIKIEEVKEATIRQQLNKYHPDFIIGADGTHSIVNRCLFPENNLVKIEFDYVLQLRYEIHGTKKAKQINNIQFYQMMTRFGMIANEYVGRYDEVNKKTPVTMQMMISKDDFEQLKEKATSKKPIQPYLDEIKVSGEEKENNKQISDVSLESIPEEVRGFINDYLTKKQLHSRRIDKNSVRISVNEAPATYAKEVAQRQSHIRMLLVGDAALGLSYFKGLNAGLESSAKFFTLLKGALQQRGFLDTNKIDVGLNEYCLWFLNEFASKKIKEVEQYSTWQIRAPMRLMEVARNVQESSMVQVLNDDGNIAEDYFRFVTKNPSKKIMNDQSLYPHRTYYEPTKLFSFGNIPASYTWEKMTKLFRDYVKPYKSNFQIRQDFKQPLVGVANVLTGTGKFLGGVFSLSPKCSGEGLLVLTRGGVEIATTPLAWIVKPITRGILTYTYGKSKIEDNAGIQKIAEQGLVFLKMVKDDNQFQQPEVQFKLLAFADDLHRKFNKSHEREQSSNVILDEEKTFSDIRATKEKLSSYQFEKYFSIFAKPKWQKSQSHINEETENNLFLKDNALGR